MQNARVVSKLVLTLSGRTCNAIYRNSNEVHVFCSSLSFQQVPEDICTSNRSRVAVGFVKTVVHVPLENERCQKKWAKQWGIFNVWKHGTCKRKGMCFVRYKTKKYTASEHLEIIRASRWCEPGWSLNEFWRRSFETTIKKLIERTDSSSKQCSATYDCSWARVARAPQHWSDEASAVQPRPHTVWFLVVSIIKMWTEWQELPNRCPGDSGNPDGLWTHFEGGVWNHHKKCIERTEACLAANGWYFEKEIVKCTTSESENDASE